MDQKPAKKRKLDLTDPSSVMGTRGLYLSALTCFFAVISGVCFSIVSLIDRGDWGTVLIGALVLLGVGPILVLFFGLWLKGKGLYGFSDFVLMLAQYSSRPGRLVNYTMWELGAITIRLEMYLNMGRLEEARKLAAQVQKLAYSSSGVPKDEVCVEALMFVGVIEARLGNFDRAIKYGASNIRELTTIFERESTMETAKNLSTAYSVMGCILDDADRIAQARKMYQNSLNLKLEYLGESNASVVYPLANIGYTLVREGKYEEAEPYLLRAKEKLSDSIHSISGIGIEVDEWLAESLLGQGKVEEAAPLVDKTFQSRLKSDSPDSPKLVYSKILKGKLEAARGDLDGACVFLEEAASSLEKTPGWNQSLLKSVYDASAQVLSGSKDTVKLAELEKKARLVAEEIESKSRSVVLVDDLDRIDKTAEIPLFEDIEKLSSTDSSANANQLLAVLERSQAKREYHHLLKQILSRNTYYSLIFLATIIVYFMVEQVSRSKDLNYILIGILTGIMGFSLYSVFNFRRRMLAINKKLLGERPEVASITVDQDSLLGVVKRISGFVDGTETGIKERIFFEAITDMSAPVNFDGSTFQALVYKNSETGKIELIETKKAILVVSNKFSRKIHPVWQVLLKLGIYIGLYLIIVAAIMLASQAGLL